MTFAGHYENPPTFPLLQPRIMAPDGVRSQHKGYRNSLANSSPAATAVVVYVELTRSSGMIKDSATSCAKFDDDAFTNHVRPSQTHSHQ
jgi:hypothetical protein